MKRKNLIALALFMAILVVIDLPRLMSSTCPAFPPTNSCGDPLHNCNPGNAPCTCAQSGCHPSPSNAATSATSSLMIVDSAGYINGTSSFAAFNTSFKYQPGEAYFIALQLIDDTSYGRYGFQMTSLNPDNSMAGSFYATDHTHTLVQTNDTTNVEYVGHRNAEISNFLNWNFVWNAPTTTHPVTFYYAYNLSDSIAYAEAIPGGTIYSGSLQIQSTVSAINNLDGRISDLDIFPNPVSDGFMLSFNLKQSNPVSINVYGTDGRLIRTLMQTPTQAEGNFSKSFNLDNLAAGVYMITLNVGEASLTKKITKL